MDQGTADSFSRRLSDFAEGLDADEKKLLDSVMFCPTSCSRVVQALVIDPQGANAVGGRTANVFGPPHVTLLRDDQLRFEGNYLGKKFDLVLGW